MRMKVSELDRNEVIGILSECKTKLDFLRHFGYKNNGAGYRFIESVFSFFDIDTNQYFKAVTKEKYDISPSFCKHCGKKLSYKQRNNKFCSNSCAASFNNMNRELSNDTKLKISSTLSQKKSGLNNKKLCTCRYCGKTFIGSGDFCSGLCKNLYEEEQKIVRWKNGENFVVGVAGVPTFIRRYLFTIHNNKCEACGWGEKNNYTNSIPLAIHHIDGDCTNNRIENLRLLCPNCHALTENFGSLNKVSRRFHRSPLTLLDVK